MMFWLHIYQNLITLGNSKLIQIKIFTLKNTFHLISRPMGTDIRPGDFITETWFMSLLISMVTVMVLLFAAMLLVRRRQMLAKKTMTTSRSNGAVLSTPLAMKHEVPLWLDKETLPDYTSSTLPEYSKLNGQEYSRVDYSSLNGHVVQNAGAYLQVGVHQGSYLFIFSMLGHRSKVQ